MFVVPLLVVLVALPVLAQQAPPAQAPETTTHPEAQAAEHGDAPSIMNVDPGLMIWTVVTFVLLLVVLRYTAWKPMIGALEAREQRIREAIDHAEKSRRDGEELLARYQAQLEHATVEAHALIERGRADAERLRQELAAQAREEAEEFKQRARREIDLAAAQAKKELWEETTLLSTLLAEKILRKSLHDADHQQLVQQVLDEYRATPPRR